MVLPRRGDRGVPRCLPCLCMALPMASSVRKKLEKRAHLHRLRSGQSANVSDNVIKTELNWELADCESSSYPQGEVLTPSHPTPLHIRASHPSILTRRLPTASAGAVTDFLKAPIHLQRAEEESFLWHCEGLPYQTHDRFLVIFEMEEGKNSPTWWLLRMLTF